MQTLLPIIADDREPPEVIEALQALEGCAVMVKRLALGDYQFGEQLLFERKTLPDFVASIMDGRLFRQAARLAGAKSRALIILEGRVKDIAHYGISREALQGALVCVSAMFGIPLLRSFDPQETARLMAFSANQLKSAQNGAVSRNGRRPKGKQQLQLRILQELPGIGPARAHALLDRYGSIENIMQADERDLAQTPGVGKDTAQRIRWTVNDPGVEYG